MLSYSSHIKVKNAFTKEILIELYLDWLQTSRNRMEGLVYLNEASFVYELDHKCLKIEDFKDYATLGLQFTTDENSRKMTFIVEVMYHYDQQTLDLNFYQELDEESIYHGIQGIPNIFKRLFESSYIEKDQHLAILNEPHFLQGKEYHETLRNYHELPLVILTRNTKVKQLCVVDPFALAKRLYGVAHVIVTNTKDASTMEILYPNTYSEKIPVQKDTHMIAICESSVHKYLSYQYSNHLKFNELMNLKLHQKHSQTKQDSSETEDLFMEEIKGLEEFYDQLDEEYKMLYQELEDLNQKEERLNKQLSLNKEEAILYSRHDDYQKDRELLVQFLDNYLKKVVKNQKFRKGPVLNSIVRRNKS